MSKRTKVRLGVALLLVLVIAFTWLRLRSPQVPVRAAEAKRESISNTISTNGTVEPIERFQAYAPAPSTVQRVLVRNGDQVKTGQVLIRMDDADLRAEAARALAQMRSAEAELAAVQAGGTQEEVLTAESALVRARNELAAAQQNLESLRRLQAGGSASAGEVRAAERRLQTAQAEVELLEQKRAKRFSDPEVARAVARHEEARATYEAAQQRVRESTVIAPRPGTVFSVPVREGAFVSQGTLLVEVADLKRMQVRAFVDEPEIGHLESGQRVTIDWDAVPDRVWEGTLTRVPTAVTTRGTRNVGEILVEVDNKDGRLIPNINVDVLITTLKVENALTIPREAIHQDDNGRYVYQVTGERLQRQPVKTGLSSLTRTEVTEGLPERALVALGATTAQPLREGMQVRVVER